MATATALEMAEIDLANSIETQVQQQRHQQSHYQNMECRNLLYLEVFFCKGFRTWSLPEIRLCNSEDALAGGRFDPTTIWLPQVTDLTLNVSGGSDTHTFMGLQELLTRCPRLERLTFSPLDRSTNLDRVATIIKDHCPKLTSILIPLTLKSDTEICKVVRAVTPGRLLELHCKAPRITKDLQDAVRTHRDSLEVFRMAVSFHIREPVDYVNGREVWAPQVAVEQMRFLQEVADSFLSLGELSFYEKRVRTTEFEFYDALMYRPWKGLNLERLELFGGAYDMSQRERQDQDSFPSLYSTVVWSARPGGRFWCRCFGGALMNGLCGGHWQVEQEGQVLSEDADAEGKKDEDSRELAQQQQKEREEEQCKSLVELDVFFFRKSGWGKVVHAIPPPAYAQVLHLNRHLRKVGLTAHEAKPQPINATALSRCLRLKELSINNFTTQVSLEQDLGLFLRPAASTLTHLTLINIRGEYTLDTTPSTTATRLWFPNVVELRTDLSPQITPGIEDLIARCPNLERLCLSPDPSLSLEPLATMLLLRLQNGSDMYTCCPKIHSLKFLSSTSEANQIHKVIEACGPLTQLEYKCNNLTQEIQRATRAHRATLEHLKMSIIFYFRQRSSQADFADTMMERPWRCDRLEELQLVVGILERRKDLEMEYLEPGRVFAHGWRVSMDVPVDRTYLKPNYVLFERFLNHVSSLPVLRKMTALRVDCVR
ncbi:hypothetical protein KI688_003050 [Linnemannia hyalina]|uniref:Uncharacterized protein n=1 Tax=Linnemannia hyalina TaxID=64524 RepID=A0A9P7XPH1_9FUNG|nr:hypothetical protein KI688_003050 [Linnemannia hyalina]